jgi:Flp pilus assembly protein TadD
MSNRELHAGHFKLKRQLPSYMVPLDFPWLSPQVDCVTNTFGAAPVASFKASKLRAFLAGGLLLACHAWAQLESNSLLQRHWFETRSTHFNIYSCGPNQQVAKVGARLEQFREAYSLLAGAQAVASPPIVVIAFPDHESMEPFLRLYQGKPANQAAFFLRGSDENFIALYLSGQGADSLDAVFHEFTHLLLRHNSLFWPMWLNEGMAEIYSTFETTPDGGIRIGKPHAVYLRLLSQRPWMSLPALFSVEHDSPDYNERDRQGIFYAESWLLTHYLMLGDNQAMKSRFGRLTALLKQGQTPEQAFTNAMGVSAAQMEKQLHGYFERGKFEPLKFVVKGNLSAPQAMNARAMTPVEIYFRLGDMLMRVERPEEAAKYFRHAAKMAPKSPLPYEGLGLLAAQNGQAEEALRRLKEALQLGSTSFLAHYMYAAERYRLTCKTPDMFTEVDEQTAAEIRGELQKSLTLMPNFGPAHRLLGFFLMVQGENMAEAEQHLQRAIQLEPENSSYQVTLAQIQTRKGNLDAARHTLEPLRLSYVAPEIRKRAEEMLQELGPAAKGTK